MTEQSRLEKLLERSKALEAQIDEEKAKEQANKVLNTIGADVATVVAKAATEKGVDIKVLHGKFFALTIGDDGKLTVEVVNKARGNGSRTPTGNGNGNGNFEYYLKDGRGPFESIQKAMDKLGIAKNQRPTHNRYDRLSADWQGKIERKAKAPQPASPPAEK